MKKLATVVTLVMLSSFARAQAPPVLLFSDLIYGPNTGWNNGTTQGAAVTVWGKNLGAAPGANSFITIGGANATTYPEWGVIGPARGLERITFFIPTTAATGSQTIRVTVNGVNSNTLPFTVDATTPIYYIDVNTGSNANSGRTTSLPFRDIYKATPGNDGHHTCPAQCNPSGDAQYIVYVRGGSYTTTDVDGYFSHSGFLDLLSLAGGPTKQKAVVAYPAETPILVMNNIQAAIQMPDDLPSGATCCGESYWTFSKLSFIKTGACASFACSAALTMYFADHFRFVGNTLQDLIPPNQVFDGIIFVGDSSNTSIYGNFWNHNGFDSFDHGIYIKVQDAFTCCTTPRPTLHTDVGWNEFANGFTIDNHGGQDIFVSHAATPSAASFPTDDTRIHHNYFHDGNSDFFYSGDNTTLNGTIYVWGNIFKGGPAVGTFPQVFMYCGTKDIYWYDNTFYAPPVDEAAGFSTYNACDGGPSAMRPRFANNIWQATSNGQVWYTTDSTGPITTFDHDLYFQPNGTLVLPTGSGVTVTSPTNGNPLMVNPPTDYHLQSSSAARGIAGNQFTFLNSLAAGSLTGAIDFDGVAYAAAGNWDAGALQFSTGSGPPPPPQPPAPPTGLTATVN